MKIYTIHMIPRNEWKKQIKIYRDAKQARYLAEKAITYATKTKEEAISDCRDHNQNYGATIFIYQETLLLD